jgi:hypothetical protein
MSRDQPSQFRRIVKVLAVNSAPSRATNTKVPNRATTGTELRPFRVRRITPRQYRQLPISYCLTHTETTSATVSRDTRKRVKTKDATSPNTATMRPMKHEAWP